MSIHRARFVAWIGLWVGLSVGCSSKDSATISAETTPVVENRSSETVVEKTVTPEETAKTEVEEAANPEVEKVANPENGVENGVATGAQVEGKEGLVEETVEPTPETAEAVEEPAKGGIDSIAPLTPEQRQKIASISWDAAPEVLNAVKKSNEGKHYLISDEDHPEVFRESISNLGGTYIGVGTEQGYVFVGWQRATLALLIDYDPWVVEMHSLLIPVIASCADSDCVIETFRSSKVGVPFFKQYAADNQMKEKDVVKRYNRFRPIWASSLEKVRNMQEKTFMNDAETYDFLHRLAMEGRMVTFQANLLDNVAFKSIGETLNDVGAKVMALYLSNTEQYWNYNDGFKQNMLGLPYGENALIMRTQATYPRNNDYRYGVMPAENFIAWLKYPRVRNAKQITKPFKIKTPEDIPFLIDDTLPPQ